MVVITNPKMWFVIGFVCDAWDRKGEGKKSHQHRPPLIARTTLHTLRISLFFSLLATGIIYLYISQYQNILALPTFPLRACAIAGQEVREEGRQEDFSFYFIARPHRTAYAAGQPAPLNCIVRPLCRTPP